MDQNNQTPNNDQLNDAVENIKTEDASVGANSAQERQNQQSTTTSVTATGSENEELFDTANEAAAEDASKTSQTNDPAATSPVSDDENQVTNDAAEGEDTSSSVIGEPLAEETSTNDAAASSNAEPQAVGGDTPEANQSSEQSALTDENQTVPTNTQAGGEAQQTASSEEDFDTKTLAEDFEVNVTDTPENEEDFDTKTVSETLEVTVNEVNDAPDVVSGIQASLDEDNSIRITQEELLANASDIEGDNLSAINLATNDPNASIIAHEDGSFTITPSANFYGEIALTYEVTDGQAVTETSLNLTVNPINDAPKAEDKFYQIEEDGSISFTDIDLLQNATDIEGDALSITELVYLGNDGVLSLNGGGSYTFSPNENFSGDIALDFTVFDGTDSTSAKVNLSVTEVNDPPVAGSLAYTINEDSVLTFNESQILANASDVEGEVSIVSITYSGTDGVLTLDEGANYHFTPNENFNGDVSLDVVIKDEDGATANTTVDIEVLPINDPPIAGSTAYTINEDHVITLTDDQLLANSSDAEGEVAVSEVSYSGTDGIFTDNGDGTYNFAPNENFNGNISLDLIVLDEAGATASTTAGIEVIAVNDPPVSGDIAYSLNEDGQITLTQAQLLSQAKDVEGDSLVASELTVGDNASVTDNGDGTFTITPDANFNGALDIEFAISDGQDTILANGNLTVNPVNDLPHAENKGYQIDEDGNITFTDSDLLQGASDIDGDTLSISDVSYSGTDGVLTINGDGSYTFSPNENFSGEVNLDFTVFDGTGTTDAKINVTVTELNDPPIAGATAYTVDEDHIITLTDEQLLANSSDVEGEVAVSEVSYSGTDGIFTDNGDGTYSFAPNENFNGNISLDLIVLDEAGATASTTAGIEVIAVNDPPVSGDIAYSLNEDGQITLTQAQLLAQATDVEGDDLVASQLVVVGDNAGVTDNGDGTFTITPDANFNGALDIEFAISDGQDTILANGNLTVNPVNDLPHAENKGYQIDEDGNITFTDSDLLQGASDIDGDTLSISDVSYSGTDGVLTINGDGSYTFSPNENFSGEVNLDFTVFDGTDTTDAKINVTVTEVNDPPIAGTTSYTIDEDSVLTFSNAQILANASDVEGDVTVSEVSYSGTDGIFTDNGDGTYSFVPNENFNGDISLDVTVVDEAGAAANTNVNVKVLPINDAPEGKGISAQVDEDNSITLTQAQLLANATDLDGDALTATNLTLVSDPSASIVENEDGSFTITPAENWNGELDFTYSIFDGTENLVANLDLTVNPVNDAPDAGNEIYIQAKEDETLGVTLRDEPAIRLDALPEYGVVQAQIDNEWVTLELGQEIAPDTEVRFVADETALADATYTTQVGTFDDNAKVSDWGDEIDPYTRQFSNGEIIVTTQSTDGPLGAWNGNTHIGHGIGDTDRQGLSGDEKLIITVEGQDINEISFELDGLGGWFLETSPYFTEVEIKAFGADGQLIDSETYHKEDDGSFVHTYTLTANEPVTRFELGTVEGSGTYVVQNVSVCQTAPDAVVFTAIGVDGAEVSETIDLNLHAGDQDIDLTANLPAFETIEEGATGFAPIIITEKMLLAQASDIDSETLDVINLTLEEDENATLTDNGDGTWTLTPAPDFVGEVALNYQVTDGELVDTNSIHIDFTAVNDAPIVSGPVVLSKDEDTTIEFSDSDLLLNASDVDGDNLSIENVTYEGTEGVFVNNGDGTYSFSANENFNGQINLSFDVTDGQESTANTIDLTVIPVNDIPVAGEPISVQMLADGSQIIALSDLLAGASDLDGDILHIENLVLANQLDGTLTDNGDNTFTFVPNDGVLGEVKLNFDISDGKASVSSHMTVTVEDTNVGPEVSGPVEATVAEDGTITLTQADLLANASDLDGDNLTAINLTTSDENATLVQNEDGSFTITPSENFNGDISFSYDITDGIATVATGLELTVTPVNDLPDVPDLTFYVDEDNELIVTKAQLLASATDIDGDNLDVVDLVSQDEQVTVTDNGDGTFTLMPAEDYFGTADLSFSVTDGTDIVAANIDLHVEFVNDAPEAGNTTAAVDEDSSILVTQEMLLENATDRDGDQLLAENLQTNDPNATVVDNGDGTFSVTPSADFDGDIELSYSVTDGSLVTDCQLTLTVNPVNDAPESFAVFAALDEDTSITLTQAKLLENATDVDGDNLVALNLRSNDENVFIQVNEDNSFTISTTEHHNGLAELQFDVSDGEEIIATDLNLTINPVNDAPEAQDKQYTIDEEGSITFTDSDLLQGTSDIEGDALSISDVSYSGTDGVLTINGDGSYTFSPNENFSGEVNLDFTVFDGTDTTNANIKVNVTDINDPPIAGTTAYTVEEDKSITLSEAQLLANSSDVEGAVSLAGVSYSGDQGKFVNNNDGTFTFTPNDNFNGEVLLDVIVKDEDGATAKTTASIEVLAANDAPNAPTIELHGEEDQVLVIDPAYILENATDLDGDDLTLESLTVRQPQGSSLQQQPDGMYHLIAPADFNGLVDLAYEISDGKETVEGSINVNLIPVNDAPFTKGNAHLTSEEDGAFTFTASDMLDLFGDIDTDNLVVSRVIMPEDENGGALADNGDGTWTFTPTDDFAGISALQVIVSDGEYESTLDVPVYIRPVADGAVITTDHQGPLVFDEDSVGHLGLNLDLLDSSETLSHLVITGFPVGFEVSDGVNTLLIESPNQYIDATSWNISDLQLTPPDDFSGSFFLTVTATTVDYGDEASRVTAEPTEAAGDFITTIDGSLLLTTDDLLEMAEEATEGDIQFVHLINKEQGEIIDNGDGTWTFTPAEGFEGTADFAYVVNHDGELIDAQSSIGVRGESETAPSVDELVTTNIAHNASLCFTKEDMLAQVSDLQDDNLSIESVQLIDGQGLLEVDENGIYTFTPAEGFSGEAQVAFVATDGNESVQSHFNINIAPTEDALSVTDEGAVELDAAHLLNQLGLDENEAIVGLEETNDSGALIDNGDDTWTFWPDDSFNGELGLSLTTGDENNLETHSLTLPVEMREQEAQTSENAENQATQSTSETQEVSFDANSAETEEPEDADINAAPGELVQLNLPESVISDESVQQVEISGLPEGASIENALEGADGSFILSGDLSKPANIQLGDEFEGKLDINLQGLDGLGNQVENASAQVSMDVDKAHSSQNTSNTDPSHTEGNTSGGDWTSGDNTNTGVDVMDDSASYDNNSQSSHTNNNETFEETI